MKDDMLLNISLGVAAIGIMVLLLLSYYDKIPEKDFNEITSDNVNSQIKVKGIVQQVYLHNNSMSIRLKQECLMDVFLFDQNQDVGVGDNLTIDGTVQEYNGRMDILASKITKNK